MDETIIAWAKSGDVPEDTAKKLVRQWRRGIISTRQLAENIAIEAPDMSKGPMFVARSSGAVALLRNRSSATLVVVPADPNS